MKSFFKRLLLKIRIWNNPYNPFFSPSLYNREIWSSFGEGFVSGIRKADAIEGVIIETGLDIGKKDETKLAVWNGESWRELHDTD